MKSDQPQREAKRNVRVTLLIGALALCMFAQSVSSWSPPDENIHAVQRTLPTEHGFWLDGSQNEVELTRARPTAAVGAGEVQINPTVAAPWGISASMPPANASAPFAGNISAMFYMSLTFGSPPCTTSTPTTVYADVTLSGQTIWSGQTEPTVIMPPSNGVNKDNPMEFPIEASNLSTFIEEGDVLTISIAVQHQCLNPARFYWGGSNALAGLTLEGEYYNITTDVSIDDLGHPSIEMRMLSPWPYHEIFEQRMRIIGPLEDEDEVFGTNRDDNTDILTLIDPHRIRPAEDNSTIWLWWSSKPLEEGVYAIEIDLDTYDEQRILIITHLEVIPEVRAGLASEWVLIPVVSVLAVVLSLIGFLRRGWPPQMMIVHLVLAVLILPMVMSIPDVSERPEIPTDAPSFQLIAHGQNTSIEFTELVKGKKALILGIVQAGSPNDQAQIDDLDQIISFHDEEVAVAQVIAGDGRSPLEVNDLAERIDGRWPLLLDEGGDDLSQSLPIGSADGMLIITPDGRVVFASGESAGMTEMTANIEGLATGNGHGTFAALPQLLLLLGLTLPFLLIGRAEAAPIEALLEDEHDEVKPSDLSEENVIIEGMQSDVTMASTPVDDVFPGGPTLVQLSSAALGSGLALLAAVLSILVLPDGMIAGLSRTMLWIIVAAIGAWATIHRDRLGQRVAGQIHQRLPESWKPEVDTEHLSSGFYAGLMISAVTIATTPELPMMAIVGAAHAGAVGMVFAIFTMLLFPILTGAVIIVFRGILLAFGSFARFLARYWSSEGRLMIGCCLMATSIWAIIALQI